MTRPPNAIDFWRGWALVTIFINHVPGLYFIQFTHRNYGFSDAAELFVFLAGWGLQITVAKHVLSDTLGQLMWHLGRRAIKIYAAQILIISLAVAMLAAASILLDNPLLVTWNNAEAVFSDPVRANVGLVALTHQLGYFNILPLYIVLTALAPLIVLIDRLAPRLLLPASAGLYAFALVTETNFPTWPVDGEWFFNPLTWQLTYVLGFFFAKLVMATGDALPWQTPVRWVALPLLVLSAFGDVYGWMPDPTTAPSPILFFIDHKTFESPIRVTHLLMLVIALSGVFPYLARHLPRFTSFLSLLGRHSLNVFCVGSLASLAAQIVRYTLDGGLLVDIAIVIAGVAIMALTAHLTDGPGVKARRS